MGIARKQLLFTVASTPAAYPSWIDTLTLNRWQAININTLANVDPQDDAAANPNYPGTAPWHQVTGQDSVFRHWNGGVFASGFGTYGSVLHYGGGHNGYSGSEVYAFDMGTRLFRRLYNPYPGPFNFPYATGVYPDGSPIPPHTYDTLVYHVASNRLVKLRSCVESSGTSSNSVEANYFQSLNLSTLVWTNSSAHAGTVHSGGHSCYDSTRELCWVSGGSSSSGFFSYDPVGNTVTRYNTKIPVMTDSAAAYDPVNDLFVVTRFKSDTRVQAWSLAGSIDSNPQSYLTTTGVAFTKESANGWEWSPAKQAFLYYRRDGAVYQLKLTSGAWNTGTWTWSLLTDAGNTVVPPNDAVDNGVYSRFQIASYSSGTREVAILCNGRSQSTYAFRIA